MAALGALFMTWGGPGAIEPASAQAVDALRQDQRQVVAPFNFESRDTFDWSNVFQQEPDLPPKGLFFDAFGDEEVSRSGEMSLRLDLRGGSVSYRTRLDLLIPAEPGCRYLVRGWVRTEGLVHAAARIEMRVVEGEQLDVVSDVEGDPVLQATVAEFASEAVRTGGEWRQVEFLVDTLSEAARFGRKLRMVMALQVVQPEFFAPDDRDRSIPLHEDVGGTAWFDDVEIWQLPRVDCRMVLPGTQAASGGVYRLPRTPVIEIDVDDPFDPAPTARVEVRNLDDEVVHHEAFTVKSGNGPIAHPLEVTSPGWYSVDLQVSSGEQLISRQARSFMVMREAEPRRWRSTPRIGYTISDWTVDDLPLHDSILQAIDPAILEMSIWPVGNDELSAEAAIPSLRTMLSDQRYDGREVLFAIDRMHPQVASAAGTAPEEVAMIFAADPLAWSNDMEHWFLAFGTLVDRWRMTALSDVPAEFVVPDELRAMMRDLVPDPVLSVPREVDALEATQSAGFETYLESTPDLSAEAQARMLSNADSDGITIRIAPPPSDWSRRGRIDEASRRIIAAWKAGADRILSPMPNLEFGPEPDALAWTALAPALESRRPAGTLHASDTATCLIADGEDGIILVAYSRRIGSIEQIDLPLGSTVVEVESIDGRSWTVPNRDGVHTIEVSSTPVIIRGADAGVVALASNTRFEPSAIASRRGPQDVALTIRNPFSFMIEGDLEFEAPDDWSMQPSRTRFRVEPNAEQRIPLTVRWDRMPQLGQFVIPVSMHAEVDRLIDARIAVPLEVESPRLEVRADWSLASSAIDGRDGLVVTMEVTNHGNQPVDLEAMAVAWRIGRERLRISDLGPGDQAIRRFQFNAGMDRLAGTDILVTVADADGPDAVVVAVPIAGTKPQTAVVETR